MDPQGWARRLPWIDGIAALTVGTLLLLLRRVLVDFYGLSLELVTFIGVVNVVYASPGLVLAAMPRRAAWLLSILIAGNLAWAVTCVAMATLVWSSASVFGLAQIIGEGLFVASLAALEALYRKDILAVER